MTHWPIHPHPEPDEVLSSWIVRLAIAHGIKLQSFCCSVWGREAQIWNRDIDKLPVPEIFSTLSEKTLTPMVQVLETHLSSYEGKLYRHHNANGNQNWLLPIRVYHRRRLAFGQQYCPHCLEEGVHLRKRWRLALVTCCEKHDTIMLDRCSACQLPIHFHRDDMGNRAYLGKKAPALCFNCRFDLRMAPTRPAKDEMIGQQRDWLTGMGNGSLGPDYFDVLRHMTTVLLSRYKMTRDIGAHAAKAMGIKWQPPIRPSLNAGLEGLSILERAHLLEIAAWLLDEWPNRLISFCTKHEIWSAALTKELPDAPSWYKDVVEANLKREIWKGTPDPRSKRARNWKPIQEVLSLRKISKSSLEKV